MQNITVDQELMTLCFVDKLAVKDQRSKAGARKRTKNISTGFKELRKLVAKNTVEEHKMSQVQTLRAAIQHIKNLTAVLNAPEPELQEENPIRSGSCDDYSDQSVTSDESVMPVTTADWRTPNWQMWYAMNMPMAATYPYLVPVETQNNSYEDQLSNCPYYPY